MHIASTQGYQVNTDGVSPLKLPRVKEKQRNKFCVPNLNSILKLMESFDKSQY